MLNYPLLYIEHLSDRDLDVIARAVPTPLGANEMRSHLLDNPGDVDDLLAAEALYEVVVGSGSDRTDIHVGITPFLLFGVLVNRVVRDLDQTTFVPEWVGAGQRLPVFDVESLREFVADGARRFFLIEFLASFTKVASGAVWIRTERGYRRRRFSELDPVSLAEMVDALPPRQRPGGYRRLGDVSLFLSGVFPDHTTRNTVGELARLRMARSAGVERTSEYADENEVRFFEIVGTGWYGRAVDGASASIGVGPRYLLDVAEHFSDARRFLNFLSDRYLHRFDTGLMNPAS